MEPVKILKTKNGKPTKIEYNGEVYNLEHKTQFRPKSPKKELVGYQK
jgi:hypothetical protein